MIGSHTSLRVVVIVHFILTVWASMTPNYLPTAYIYMNLFILAFGAYGILNPDNVEAVFMCTLLSAASILLDAIMIGIHEQIGHGIYEKLLTDANQRNEYRFSLGMSIINLLIKPFTTFVLYRIYQDRGGQYGDFNIPGMPAFGGGHPGTYENIDSGPAPSSGIESASPHSYDKPPYEP